MPLCSTDADCWRGAGAGYGCNPWSRKCEAKDKALPKYGAACAADSSCESGICLPDRGGYCAGLCTKGGSCAPDGTCAGDGTSDSTGRCFDTCANAAECTRAAPYQCAAAPYGGASSQVCYCRRSGEPCSVDGDCCNPGQLGFPACFVVFGSGSCAF